MSIVDGWESNSGNRFPRTKVGMLKPGIFNSEISKAEMFEGGMSKGPIFKGEMLNEEKFKARIRSWVIAECR
jgi:hypothetical protein